MAASRMTSYSALGLVRTSYRIKAVRDGTAGLTLRSHLPRSQRYTGNIIRGGPTSCQRRWQSAENTSDQTRRPPTSPKPTFGQVMLAALRGSLRNLRNGFRSRNLKAVYRESPGEFMVAIFVITGGVAGLALCVYLYFVYFNAQQFTRYPPPVAKALRRALYYSNISPDHKLALKYYKIALEKCDELHLDTFSDDVMGIKIQLAAWLEKIGGLDAATRVLETLLTDCKRFVEVVEQSAKDGTLPKHLLEPPKPIEGATPAESTSTSEGGLEQPWENAWGKRRRVLAKAVQISVKLGDLYSNEHIMNSTLAHDRLAWAAETALKELQRRRVGGVKDGEGDWMSAEYLGGTLEALGHSYESRSQFHLALPLFFHALQLCRDPCHSAVLMNNIAISYAQHPILPPSETPLNSMLDQPLSPGSATPAETRKSYLEAANRWARNAQRQAKEPKGDLRTAECDEACAVSLCNLGDIAKLAGDLKEARRMFEKAAALSEKIEFAPGLAQAQKSLQSFSQS